MPDCDTLLERARVKPATLRFTEVCELAECFGFTFARQQGTSHKIYKRSGYIRLMTFQEGKNGMAIAYQVRQLINAIDELKAKGEV